MLITRFYLEKIEDRAASEATGSPMWKDEERCSIIIPGDREEEVIHIVNADRLKSWRTSRDPGHNAIADQYDRWKAGQDEPATGTPLELCGFLTPAMIENLKAPPRHTRTVEQLADLSDAQGGGIPMFMSVRDKARKFLENRNGPAALAARQSEQEVTIGAQAKQIADLTGQLTELLKRLPAASVPSTSALAGGDATRTASGVMPVDDDDIGVAPAGSVRADAGKVAKTRAALKKEQEAA